MWYRIEWSDLYISDFGASQIKTVENCTNPGGPLDVGTQVKVYCPSEKKYWFGEIIRISARKADLDKVTSSDQPERGVAEHEIGKFLTGLQDRGQLTPAIMKVLQRVDAAGTIGTLFNPMIHEVTSTCNNDSDEDVLDKLIQKFLTMKADGFNGQLWKEVLFKAPRKGDRLAFIGATLMTMFRDSGMQSAQPSKKADKAKKKRKALADITTPQPKHRAKKHDKENIPPVKRSKKEDAKALERKQAREVMRHLMAQQNTTTETDTQLQEANTQDSEDNTTEMDIQCTTTETDTLTQNTSTVGLPHMTATDTQHANQEYSRAENDTPNSITETNTHTQNTSTETDTGHTNTAAENITETNFTQPANGEVSAAANTQHTTAETDTPPQNTSTLHSRTEIDIQQTSTAVDSTHTIVSNTSNSSATSCVGLLTQTTNILENIDSPQYAQSHPTLYDSPHTHYRHNIPQQTHNGSYQNFEHPSSNYPQNWYAPSTPHMPHLQNLDMLTSSVNEIRYYVEQTYRDATFIRQQLGFRNEQNSPFTQAINEPCLTSTPARSQRSYSSQISEVAQMSARNAESPAKAVRILAMSAFGVEVLKKSTVSGVSTTRSHREKLDPLILKEIQDFMASHFNVNRSFVNQIVGNKIRELQRDRRMDVH